MIFTAIRTRLHNRVMACEVLYMTRQNGIIFCENITKNRYNKPVLLYHKNSVEGKAILFLFTSF